MFVVGKQKIIQNIIDVNSVTSITQKIRYQTDIEGCI